MKLLQINFSVYLHTLLALLSSKIWYNSGMKKSIFAIAILILLAVTVCAGEVPEKNTAPEQFSFVWISDTQTITEKPALAEKIPCIFDWIVRSARDYGMIGVFHTGDIVENGWNDRYWERITKGIDLLPEDMPFIAAAGNHDVAKKKFSYEPWFKQNFVKNEDHEHQYKNGEGYYCLFYPGNEKIVAVSIGYNSIDKSGMEWVRNVFDSYPDHTGILIVHSFLSYNNDGESLFTRHGKKLYDEVVIPCDNVRLVLSGHIHGSSKHSVTLKTKSGTNRIVHMLRYDCQNASYVDLIGYLRILRFDPSMRTIEVLTYSPVQDDVHYRYEKPENEHFILENAF